MAHMTIVLNLKLTPMDLSSYSRFFTSKIVYDLVAVKIWYFVQNNGQEIRNY